MLQAQVINGEVYYTYDFVKDKDFEQSERPEKEIYILTEGRYVIYKP